MIYTFKFYIVIKYFEFYIDHKKPIIIYFDFYGLFLSKTIRLGRFKVISVLICSINTINNS